MTATFAASTLSRRGTAVNVSRIWPVLYSAVIVMMPRMPTASAGYDNQPAKIPATAPNGGAWEACTEAVEAATTPVASRAVTAATSRVTYVERSARSLVHSLSITIIFGPLRGTGRCRP